MKKGPNPKFILCTRKIIPECRIILIFLLLLLTSNELADEPVIQFNEDKDEQCENLQDHVVAKLHMINKKNRVIKDLSIEENCAT